MPTFTARGISAPSGSDQVAVAADVQATATTTNAAIDATENKSIGYIRFANGTDLDSIDAPGTGWASVTVDNILNAPAGEGSGFVQTLWRSTTARVQLWQTSGSALTTYVRFRGSTGWTAWKRIDAAAAFADAAKYTDGATPGAGNKVVPLALTAGGSSATYAVTTRGIRMPMNYTPTISRWRVHVRNINPRFGTNQSGAISLTGLWFGAHNGSGNFTGTATQIVGAVSTPADGSEYVSPWVSSTLGGGASFLLAYGFTAGAVTQSVVGGGWYTTAAADATNNAAGKTVATTMPLDVWIEAEVPASVPVIAAVGDSLSVGVGSTIPVNDSTVSQYARANNALPMHYASSGENASSYVDPAAYKWTRWAGFARPDAAIVGIGSNDIFGGNTLGTVQTNYQTVINNTRALLTSNIYAVTLMPRDAITGTMETTRRSFNTWLKAFNVPQVRDVFDIVPGVSADDETLTPALQSDGIHLNTAGYAANRDAITRKVAPAGGDVPASSVVLLYPNGTKYAVTVSNAGVLSTSAV